MLGWIVDHVTVRDNLRIIAPQGRLHSSIEDGPALGSAGLWQGYPCYLYHLIFNKVGLIRHADSFQERFMENSPRYHQSSFLVAVDTHNIMRRARLGIADPDLREEYIVRVDLHADAPARAAKIIQKTAEAYNKDLGFDPTYDRLAIRNFLGERI